MISAHATVRNRTYGALMCSNVNMQDANKNVGQVHIKSIGITNQRETTIIWRRSTGKPCYNAIVWLDTRTRHVPIYISTAAA